MPDFTGTSSRGSQAAARRRTVGVVATARAIRDSAVRPSAFDVDDVVMLFSDHSRRGRVVRVFPNNEYEITWDTKPVFTGIYLEDELEKVDKE